MDQMKGNLGPVGYAHPLYALSLQEFGNPRELPHCRAWVLERSILGTHYKDAMGCYPFFLCRDPSKIGDDLKDMKSKLVSLVLVTDPFSQLSLKYFTKYFDIVIPYKTHFVVNLSYSPESFLKKVYKKNIRDSLKQMEIEICHEPIRYLHEWIKLYENLKNKHNIKGISAFSPKSFAIQFQIPGTILVIAKRNGEFLGANIVIVQDDVAYGHLAAFSSEGYRKKASYGIKWIIINYLRGNGIKYYDLGGTAGIHEKLDNGLAKYKAGWSNDRRTVYLCGRIFDDEKYKLICHLRQINEGDYFPLYRKGEFL